MASNLILTQEDVTNLSRFFPAQVVNGFLAITQSSVANSPRSREELFTILKIMEDVQVNARFDQAFMEDLLEVIERMHTLSDTHRRDAVARSLIEQFVLDLDSWAYGEYVEEALDLEDRRLRS